MDNLIGEFIAEATDELTSLHAALARRPLPDANLLAEVLQLSHTITSTSGFLQLPRLSRLSIALEAFLDHLCLSAEKTTAAHAALIGETLRQMEALILHLEEGTAEMPGNDTALIARLHEARADISGKQVDLSAYAHWAEAGEDPVSRHLHHGPLLEVMETITLDAKSSFFIEKNNDAATLRLGKRSLPLVALSQIFGKKLDVHALKKSNAPVMVCRLGDRQFALLMDKEDIIAPPAKVEAPPAKVEAPRVEAPKPAAAPAASIRFLLFSIGDGRPKAVPLEVVTQEISVDVTAIELLGDAPAARHNGKLLRLVMLEGSADMPYSGSIKVLQIGQGRSAIGLVVTDVLGPVAIPATSKLVAPRGKAKQAHYLGNLPVGDTLVDVVDLHGVLTARAPALASA